MTAPATSATRADLWHLVSMRSRAARISLASLLFASSLLCAWSCSNGSSTASNGGGGGPNPPVTLPDGGALPALSCGDETVTSLSGTWDVIGTSSGSAEQTTAIITINDSAFSFVVGSSSITFTANGGTLTLVWQNHTQGTPITTTHDRSDTFSLGLIPLPAPGSWSFASAADGKTCTASLAKDAFNATCNDVSTGQFGGLRGTIVAQRIETRTSLFGELGGVWHLTGGGAAIDTTISDNTFTSVVSEGAGHGWIHVKLCNGKASGVTSGGFELSATRR